jgi:hypothetical protein
MPIRILSQFPHHKHELTALSCTTASRELHAANEPSTWNQQNHDRNMHSIYRTFAQHAFTCKRTSQHMHVSGPFLRAPAKLFNESFSPKQSLMLEEVDVEKEALNMLKHPRTAGPPYSFREGGMRAPTSENDRVGGRPFMHISSRRFCGVDTKTGALQHLCKVGRCGVVRGGTRGALYSSARALRMFARTWERRVYLREVVSLILGDLCTSLLLLKAFVVVWASVLPSWPDCHLPITIHRCFKICS